MQKKQKMAFFGVFLFNTNSYTGRMQTITVVSVKTGGMCSCSNDVQLHVACTLYNGHICMFALISQTFETFNTKEK